MSKNIIFSNYMRSSEMIACGLSLAHRAKYGKLKSRILGYQHPPYVVRYFTKMKSDQIDLKTIPVERSRDG